MNPYRGANPFGRADIATALAALAEHIAAGDPHPQYLTQAEADALYSVLAHLHDDRYYTETEVDTLFTNHGAAADPHPGYLTPAEGDALFLTPAEGNAAYEVVGAVAAHEAAVNPHPVYLTQAEADALYSVLAHTHDDRYYTETEADALFLTEAEADVLFLTPAEGNAAYSALGHTHLLASGATDVTMSAANLNSLDDGVNSNLHFHAADRARAVHTGTQLASTISDFSEAVDDRVAALLVEGANITLTYDDGANTLTITATQASTDLDNLISTAEVLGANKSRVYASPITITDTGSLQIPATSQVAIVG